MELENVSYQKQLHVSWKKPEASSKVVILNLKDGDFYSLEDEISIGIWEGLMEGKTPADVLQSLQQTFSEINADDILRETNAFIGDLVANKLICPRPCSGQSI